MATRRSSPRSRPQNSNWSMNRTASPISAPKANTGFVNALDAAYFRRRILPWRTDCREQTRGRAPGAVRLALALAQKAGVHRVYMGVAELAQSCPDPADLGLEMVPFDHANPDGSANLDASCWARSMARAREAGGGCCTVVANNPDRDRLHARRMDRDCRGFCRQRHLPESSTLPIRVWGRGLEEDAAGMRAVLAARSRSFRRLELRQEISAQYRDRVGAFHTFSAQGRNTAPDSVQQRQCAGPRVAGRCRPITAATAVRIILRDPDMTKMWLAELDTMRARMRSVRDALAAQGSAGRIDLTPLGTPRTGCFAMLPVTTGRGCAPARGSRHLHGRVGPHQTSPGLTMANLPKFSIRRAGGRGAADVARMLDRQPRASR